MTSKGHLQCHTAWWRKVPIVRCVVHGWNSWIQLKFTSPVYVSQNTVVFNTQNNCMLGMLKINRLTGLQGKTGPETAGPVSHAVIQCLHIMVPCRAQISLPPPQIFTSLLYTPKQRNICRGIQHSVGLQWEHVSVDGRSSLHPWTSTYPAVGTAAFIVMHVTWMSVLDRCQISLVCSVWINARTTAVAFRPTAVSEGRPANRHQVQWQRAQRRLRKLTGLFDLC